MKKLCARCLLPGIVQLSFLEVKTYNRGQSDLQISDRGRSVDTEKEIQ